MGPKTNKFFRVVIALAVVLAFAACRKVTEECTRCESPTAPSTPVAIHPTIVLVFVMAGSNEVRCHEPLVVQGKGFTAGKGVVMRVAKTSGVYNDFPEQGRPPLVADGSGEFQFTLEYERFWDAGAFTLRAYDVQTGIWTPTSSEFTVIGCGGGSRPTPSPPAPTPAPTPTPTCAPAPALSVSPADGPVGTLFVLLVNGLCAGDPVFWTVSPFPSVTTTAAPDGTSTWTYNSSGDVPGTTRSGHVESGGKKSNVVSWTIK